METHSKPHTAFKGCSVKKQALGQRHPHPLPVPPQPPLMTGKRASHQACHVETYFEDHPLLRLLRETGLAMGMWVLRAAFSEHLIHRGFEDGS